MKCLDYMQSKPVTVRSRDPVHLAARRMRAADVGFLPVCADDHVLQGVITDRDLVVRVFADDRPGSTPVAEAMTTRGLVTCRADAPPLEALRAMKEAGVARLPIVDEHRRVVGVLSLADLLSMLGEDSLRAWRAVAERSRLRPPDELGR